MPRRNIAVDGGLMPVAERGSGPPVVLLHGWSLDHRIWEAQLAALSREFQVIAPDRRGFGGNRTPPDLSREIADLDALLDEFGYASVHLLGMSQGGRIALRYAAARASRVRSLILHAAPLDGFQPPPHPGEAIPFSYYRELARAGEMETLRAAWRRHKLMEIPETKPELDGALAQILAGYRGADLTTERVDPDPPNLAGRLFEIEVDTLLLVGARDSRWFHLVSQALAYALASSRKRILRGGGHLVNMTRPKAYNTVLGNFLRTRSPA